MTRNFVMIIAAMDLTIGRKAPRGLLKGINAILFKNRKVLESFFAIETKPLRNRISYYKRDFALILLHAGIPIVRGILITIVMNMGIFHWKATNT